MAFPGAGIGGDYGAGLGGLGGGVGGFGFPGAGVGGGLNLDVGGGLGFPGLGLAALGGGLPGWTGFGGPYIPSTPLGALEAIKGDLIVPIVAIGVALFLLVLIVLAVKAALAWKLSLLSDVAESKKWRRDVGSAPAPHLDDDRMMEMARMIMASIYSDSCSNRVMCDMAAYARSTKQFPAALRLAETFMPAEYVPALEIMRNSAEGSLECERQFPCGTVNNSSQKQDQPGTNNNTQGDVSTNEVQPQKRHVPVQQNPSQPQLPIPLQVTPRPTLLEGIKVINASAVNASKANEVRPNVHKPTKYRPTSK